ncbi:hypothetical protein DHODJN_17815 [Methylorubrum extorquens]
MTATRSKHCPPNRRRSPDNASECQPESSCGQRGHHHPSRSQPDGLKQQSRNIPEDERGRAEQLERRPCSAAHTFSQPAGAPEFPHVASDTKSLGRSSPTNPSFKRDHIVTDGRDRAQGTRADRPLSGQPSRR